MDLFRHSRRELSRLVSITKSPVHSHLSEVKDGLVSVRALGLQAVDTGAMLSHIDYANKPRYYRDLTLCWLGVRLQSISSTLSGAVAVAAVLGVGVPALSFISASPQMLAVVLSTTLTMSNIMRWCVEQGACCACVSRLLAVAVLSSADNSSRVATPTQPRSDASGGRAVAC